MRVPIDTDALMASIHRHWAEQQQVTASARARVASGSRILSAADDAAGLSITERQRTMSQGQYQASRNAQEGISLAQVADGAMSQMTELLQRARVLALQSANGTYTPAQRGALQKAMDHSLAELDSVVTGTRLNGVSLLDGSRPSISLQVGADAGQSSRLDLARVDRDGLGLAGALSIAEQPDAESALDLLNDAIDELMAQRAQMAAAQQSLEGLARTLAQSGDLAAAGAERVAGADIGAEAMRMIRAQLVADVGVGLMEHVQQVQASLVGMLLPTASASATPGVTTDPTVAPGVEPTVSDGGGAQVKRVAADAVAGSAPAVAVPQVAVAAEPGIAAPAVAPARARSASTGSTAPTESTAAPTHPTGAQPAQTTATNGANPH